jgi:hypothetical protein
LSPSTLLRKGHLASFGRYPVLLVCSSTGGEFTSFTNRLGETAVPLEDRFKKLGLSYSNDWLGTSGFPGWEQACCWFTNDELELLCFAYGGSDPGRRAWSRYADQKHTMATYNNLVGIVLVSEIIQFDITQFNRLVLKNLQEVIPENMPLLPILILKKPGWLNRNEIPDQQQRLWMEGEGEFRACTRPVGIFHIGSWELGLNWLYNTRLNLLNHREK